MSSEVGWGVLGCASIATKVCRGMLDGGQTIVAVGSRSKEKADTWSKQYAPGAKGYGSYDEVLDDAEVTVVYIPLPTTMKKEWVLKAAAKGKHVLCDKPLSVTTEDAEEMIQACAKAGVQFMDNTMLMHNERTENIQKVIRDHETFGRVKAVTSCFSIPFGNTEEFRQSNIRMDASTEPLGSLGDLTWYCVRISLLAFEYEEPEDVCCTFLETTDDRVPVTVQGMLRFSGGRFASFDSSFKCALRQVVDIVGEKRNVTFDDFVVTAVKDKASFEVREGSVGELAESFPIEVKHRGHVEGCVQHARLAKRMGELAASGSVDSHWPKIALQTQKVVSALYESGKNGGCFLKP